MIWYTDQIKTAVNGARKSVPTKQIGRARYALGVEI
jgi:hypothetical protein